MPQMILSEYGQIVKTHIESMLAHYNNIFIDKYIIMPNHIHMIVIINTDEPSEKSGAPSEYTDETSGKSGGASAAPTTTLGNIIRGLKAGISRECKFSVWQRSFHDRIIRNKIEYQKIWQYID